MVFGDDPSSFLRRGCLVGDVEGAARLGDAGKSVAQNLVLGDDQDVNLVRVAAWDARVQVVLEVVFSAHCVVRTLIRDDFRIQPLGLV